jgi:hypothetical protein
MDEVFAGATQLSLVRSLRERERTPNEALVDVGLVRLDVRNQLLNEVLVLLLSLEDRHLPSVVGPLP